MKKVIRKIYGVIRKKIKLNNFIKEIKNNERNIILFGAPYHSNMGDHAQTYCILNWFKNNYPNYKVHVFTLVDCDEELYASIRKNIKKNDKIFFHSGYHLTDLYREQDVYVRIAELFPDYKITIFPQTINYLNKRNEDITASIFNKHGNITLLCRDEISYKTAQSKFKGCNILLYPDIVTSLIGTKKFNYERKGILLCMRNDKEAFYSKDDIKKLSDKLNLYDMTHLTDTTINKSYQEIISKREEILDKIFDDYSKYKLIITDRYHGVIFSLISGTPVIVLSSTDHKLSSGVKWFKDLFKEHVFYANDLNEAYNIASKILDNYVWPGFLPAYFKEKYYDNLKSKLEG